MFELLVLGGLGLLFALVAVAAAIGVIVFFVKLVLLVVLLPLRLVLLPVRLALGVVLGLLALPLLFVGLVLGSLAAAGFGALIAPLVPVLFVVLLVWLIVRATSKPATSTP